ncbi:hypothetical protein [Roseobacter sp. S98]|uniref:hypothetical protein n=1 Tax=Roseobacter algicola (ex Choi et al. 2025) (nom. illeg.) TaxID=3092138 RepID=UPI0035C6F2A5
MILTRTIAVVALAAGMMTTVGTVSAQDSLRPSEFPPVTFRGKQYVDSAGCVFTRVGVDDAVRWAPRVDRNRQQICGRAPTFDTPAQPGKTAPVPVPAAGGTTIAAAPEPAAETVVAAATPAATPQKPRRKKTSSARRAQVQGTPALQSVAGIVVTPETAQALGISGSARVLPKHVFEERRDFKPVRVPKGYRKAWNDGRMNPRRAEQTLVGHAKMQETWTLTTPMVEPDR